jgi:hypothetical protein
LFSAAGKKVVETIHMLASGTWHSATDYYKAKKAEKKAAEKKK